MRGNIFKWFGRVKRRYNDKTNEIRVKRCIGSSRQPKKNWMKVIRYKI